MDRLEREGAEKIVLGPLDQAGVAQLAADVLQAKPHGALLKMAERVGGSEPPDRRRRRLRHLAWRPSGRTGLSAAGAAITGRRRRFVLHATPNRAGAEYSPSPAARDREVICAQILRLWPPPPARTARRRVPRTRRRTLTAGEWLYVRWAALTCSPLPCAIDSRRAKARYRLVPDGAGGERRRCDRHHRPVRRCLYRCLARLAASLLPRGAPTGLRRRLAGHRDHHAHQPPLLRPRGLHSPATGASSPDPEGIITGGYASKTGRTVAIRYGEAVTAHALIALFRQIIAADRVGGWRELGDIQRARGWAPDSAVFRAGGRPDECRKPVPALPEHPAGYYPC